MFSKKNLTVALLTLTLLVAPATLAAPSVDRGAGWMDSITSFFADVFGFLGLDRFADRESERPGQLEPIFGSTCGGGGGEHGPHSDPSGCP
ncbi:MAG: hypothetical protein MPN21_10215 [Thermoanaerobaculia bacterium]|nr:hypothetical protein [Thermoanaerobaculia bacterium]